MSLPSVSFYTNNPTPYQVDLFEQLKKYTQLRVCYFTMREGDRQWNLAYENAGYEVVILKNSRLIKWVNKRIVSFHFSFKIIPLLFRDKSETVIVNGTYWVPNVLLAMLISRSRGKKVIYWGEAILPVKNNISFIIKYILFLPTRVLTNALMAIGKVAVDSYRRYGYRKEIVNVPYSIDSTKFVPENLSKTKLDQLCLEYKSAGEIVFLTSGSLIPRKGTDIIIKAFLKLEKPLKARLLILGDGPLKAELSALAAENSNIHFLGFREKEDVPYYFSVADVFVFASHYDGWALVINEALAAGLAIICSNKVGAAADNLENGINAVILSPEDVDGYVVAMQKLITDTCFRATLISNSGHLHERISADYNAKLIYGICRLT